MSLVVIGGSAGGIQALVEVVRALPSDLPAAVAVVIHTNSRAPAVLPAILARSSSLPVSYVESTQSLQPGTIVVAPPDRHLVITGSHVGLGDGPHENGHRPSIDVLFRSAAVSLGNEVTAVVLSGVLDDGAAGLHAVAAQGGRTAVQDPSDALYQAMPANALHRVPDSAVAPADQLGRVISDLVSAPPGSPPEDVLTTMQIETAFALMDGSVPPHDPARRPGAPSAFACPDCHGVLWGIEEGQAVRYRCRVGHAWSAESLAEKQDTAVESALYIAMRTLEERAELAAQMHDAAQRDGRSRSAAQFAHRAEEARAQARAIQALLPGHPRHDEVHHTARDNRHDHGIAGDGTL